MEPLPWTINEVISATGGKLLTSAESVVFQDILIDSRTIREGCLFAAIKGQRFDGHDFVHEAVQKGAKGLLISKAFTAKLDPAALKKKDVCCISVGDTVSALGDLASYRLKKKNIPVVAITGSNGKTTTKEITSLVLGQRYRMLTTKGNFNNEIGLPLTLFQLNDHHEAAVLELGMNHLGEIRRLSRICRPDIGIITNIGPAHLEGLGNLDNVMAAKGELLENIKSNGTLILNGHDSRCRHLGGTFKGRVLYFGHGEKLDVQALDVRLTNSGSSFQLALPAETLTVNFSVFGRFMVSNALAAAAVGLVFGLSGKEIKQGIEAFAPVKGRMNLIRTTQRVFIIDDTYNANPGSMAAAIASLEEYETSGKRLLILGDMLELGVDAAIHHENIGRLAALHRVQKLYATGQFADLYAKGAMAAGMQKRDIFIGEREGIVSSLRETVTRDDILLIKGSRDAGMEEIVEELRERIK